MAIVKGAEFLFISNLLNDWRAQGMNLLQNPLTFSSLFFFLSLSSNFNLEIHLANDLLKYPWTNGWDELGIDKRRGSVSWKWLCLVEQQAGALTFTRTKLLMASLYFLFCFPLDGTGREECARTCSQLYDDRVTSIFSLFFSFIFLLVYLFIYLLGPFVFCIAAGEMVL